MTKKVYTGRTILATRRVNTLPGYELADEKLIIRNDGVLIGVRGKPIGYPDSRGGYQLVSLMLGEKRSTALIHRLVALAFIDNPENKEQVNHIDEVKTNNHVLNLEWCTRVENMNHGTRTERARLKTTNGKLSKSVIGTCVKTGKQIVFPSTREAGRQGFNQGNVAACCRGERNSDKGYTWEFKEEELK